MKQQTGNQATSIIYVMVMTLNCLQSHGPLWSDVHPTDITSQWHDDWKSVSVVNSSLVDDPTVRQRGYDLPHHYYGRPM